MRVRGTLFVSILFVPFLSQYTTLALSSPASSPVSGILEKSGKWWNKTKDFLGFTPATSTVPPSTTKASIKVRIIPISWPKKVRNTTMAVLSTTQQPVISTRPGGIVKKIKDGILKQSGKWLNKSKQYLGFPPNPTTSKPRELVWPIPVSGDTMAGIAAPLVAHTEPSKCPSGQNASSGGQCGAGAPTAAAPPAAAGFSWWMLVLALGCVAAAGAGAWILFARGRWQVPEAPRVPWGKPALDAEKVLSLKKPKVLSRPRIAPPPPPPSAQRVNSLYQPSVLASLHIYARPSTGPAPAPAAVAWSSNVSDYVHIYEEPPCFPADSRVARAM